MNRSLRAIRRSLELLVRRMRDLLWGETRTQWSVCKRHDWTAFGYPCPDCEYERRAWIQSPNAPALPPGGAKGWQNAG